MSGSEHIPVSDRSSGEHVRRILTRTFSETVKLSFAEFTVTLIPAGADIQVLVLGGKRPHIGCTVLAVPRPSLTGDGTVSCTSSVLNATGHKDEALVRTIAENVCKTYGCVVSASGGFHMDGLSEKEIREVREAARRFKPQPSA